MKIAWNYRVALFLHKHICNRFGHFRRKIKNIGGEYKRNGECQLCGSWGNAQIEAVERRAKDTQQALRDSFNPFDKFFE